MEIKYIFFVKQFQANTRSVRYGHSLVFLFEIFSSYSGSRFNGEPHGFGRSEQPDFTHTGWFENGKAFGFGTRFYKNGSIDVGHWEVDSLVQVAKFYPNGLKTQMEFLFGPGTKAFKTQGL